MLGAIIGDMVGSLYEFHPIKRKDFNIYDNRMRMTDDSYLTIAVAKVLMNHYPLKYDDESRQYRDIGQDLRLCHPCPKRIQQFFQGESLPAGCKA